MSEPRDQRTPSERRRDAWHTVLGVAIGLLLGLVVAFITSEPAPDGPPNISPYSVEPRHAP